MKKSSRYKVTIDFQTVCSVFIKLQVKGLGCTNFAILFDDIEPDLCEEDEVQFRTVANAQCSIANDLYKKLEPEVFLFCPTGVFITYVLRI
jgi:hypothetical protein